ncbi:restriction endonuclease subunit S [uncultured Ferrimonas sp.]|uniref:restriction endonuclease subunit S n=1 Tax=uncultured Ferrimonas sp. TaxID=432640 RepID=UPI0026089131|nr:restriction endonuclease subunit S [uncultured Ferrimonas sp.]
MVPNGWGVKSLSEIAKEKISYGIVQAGKHIEDGVPYIKSSDVGGVIDIASLQKTSPEIHHKYRRSAVHPNDIVFSLRGNIGRTSIVPEALPEANLTQGTARISVNANNDTKYVYYTLASATLLNRINALSKGSTFKEISLEELRKVKLSIPPLPEQRKIAQILGAWDKAIATTEQLIATSKQQKKALMQQLLTGKKRLLNPETCQPFEGEWMNVSLKNVAKLQAGKFVKASNISATQVGGRFPCFGGNGLRGFTESYTHDGLYSLIGRQGALCGNITLASGKFHATEHAVVVNPLSEIETKWLYFKLVDLNLNQYATGQAQPGLSVKNIETVELNLPSFSEQQKIASVLTAADNEIEALEAKLAHFKQEKKALMQQLLTGKRRVIVDDKDVA